MSIAKKHRTSTLADISTAISRQGTNISLETVRQRLNEQSIFELQLLAKLLLSDDNRKFQLK